MKNNTTPAADFAAVPAKESSRWMGARFVLAIVLAFLSAIPIVASAQTGSPPSTQDLSLVHQPPSASSLPLPGGELEIAVSIANSRNTSLQARVFLTRDGRLMDIPLTKSYLDDWDQATYSTVIHAPVVEMSYQFVVYNTDGKAAVTDRYWIRRDCLPDIKTTSTELDPHIGLDQKLRTLIQQAKGLERDIAAYETALKILEELKSVVPGEQASAKTGERR